MAPDMSEWLSSWMASKEVPSLKTLLSKLGYREPLEALSCFCCILGDNEINQYSTDALNSARDAINKQRRLMREASAFKDETHPAIILQKVLAPVVMSKLGSTPWRHDVGVGECSSKGDVEVEEYSLAL